VSGPVLSVYAPLGMLGYGFPRESLQAALNQDLAVFAMDAGSTDPGPYYLGSGRSFTSRTMVKRDLDLLLPAARERQIPLLIGSAGGAGAAPHVARTVAILREVALEHDLHFRLAIIHADQDPERIKSKIVSGEIDDFEAGYPIDESDVDACTNIVAQMGVEPLIAALAAGADVVLAGRAFDAALMAAVPIMNGYDPGLALHMGKILECGSFVAIPRTSDGAIAHLTDDSFLVEPADPDKRCTVDLVAAHTLYEKSDPYRLHVPGGVLDLTSTKFERHDDRTVRVSGSRFMPGVDYWVKLEGAVHLGFRSICIAGARDPILIDRFDEVIDKVKAKVARDLGDSIPADTYTISFRLYGRDGVMGPLEPHPASNPQELGVVIEVVAPTQDIADTVCALVRSATLHMGYQGRLATGGNLAFPYSPAEFAGPEAYEFRLYHLMRVDDPCEMFRTTWHEV
jgi:hypothetical protein